MESKKCTKCGEVKPLDGFYFRSDPKPRWTGECKACLEVKGKQYRDRNREKRRGKDLAYREAHREEASKRSRDWLKANPEKAREAHRSWDAKNKEKVREIKERWRVANKDKLAAALAAYRAKKLRATPEWRDSFLIAEAYPLAKLRTQVLGFRWQVDHIIPLRSDRVCGLHVESNLRVIPFVANRAKSNLVWPDMPEALPSNMPLSFLRESTTI